MKKTIALALLLLSPSAYAATSISDVPSCASESLWLRPTGWLTSADGAIRVDHHALLEDPGLPGVPDELWHRIDADDSGLVLGIRVCREGAKLVYSVAVRD